MAYPIRSATLTQAQASGTTFTPSALPAHQSGDLIILFINNQGAGSSWTVTVATGWTVATRVSNTTHNCSYVYKIAASSSETIPTINGLSSNPTTCVMMVWRDADPTTPIDGSASQANGTGASSYSSPALTPSSNDCALIYWGAGNGLGYSRYAVEELENVLTTPQQYAINVDSSTAQNNVYITHQRGTAAAVTDWPLYTSLTTGRSVTWVIAIKNKSGGKASASAFSGVKELLWGNTPATTPGLGSFTLQSPDNYAASITGSSGSVDVSTASATATDDFDAAIGYGFALTLTTTENFASPASKFVGRNISATFPDLTGKVVSFLYRLNQANSAAFVGTDGFLVGFSDGTNRVTYQVKSKAQYVASTWYRVFLELGVSSAFESSGSINWAAVVDCAFLMHRNASSGTSQVVRIKDFVVHDGATKLLGGTTAIPVSFADMHRCLTQNGILGLASKQGSYQYLATGDVTIGDGTNETKCDTSAQGFEFPVGQSATADRDWRVAANKNTLQVYGSANDSISISPGTLAATVEQNFTVHASSSGSATYSFAGESFINMLVTLATNVPMSGVTFKGCDEVVAKGATVSDFTISNTTSTDAAIAFDTTGGTLSSGTINLTGTSAAYHLELGTACESITLTDVTFTGTPGTDKVHVRKTTGTVTITISGTTALTSGDVTTEGATVNIVAPQPTLDATVLSGSRVVLYNNTTDAELDNTAPGGTSWSFVVTSGATIGDNLTLFVFKEGYEEYSTSFLYSGEDTTLLVEQEVHPHIASLRTELGITDYTTITEFSLDTTGTVEIDADDADGSSQKARLAIWYNGVLTTEDGARYLRGSITILTTAAIRINVDVLDLKIENVSATYGLNFTDTERRLYRSDGTPIYAAASAPGSIQNDYEGVPDTVETGVSGLTGAESAQLMGLPSAATVAIAVWSKELPL